MTQVATFTLKCVGCNKVEDRPAAGCREMPFCNDCFMPMVLQEVSIWPGKERAKGNEPRSAQR